VRFGIERITAPDGTIFHDSFTPNGGTSPTSLTLLGALAAASIPQGTGIAERLPAGTWRVRWGAPNGASRGRARGLVRVQTTSDGAFYGGRLALHLHLLPGLVLRDDGITRPVNTADPGADPNLARRVDLFFRLVDQLLGFDRGTR